MTKLLFVVCQILLVIAEPVFASEINWEKVSNDPTCEGQAKYYAQKHDYKGASGLIGQAVVDSSKWSRKGNLVFKVKVISGEYRRNYNVVMDRSCTLLSTPTIAGSGSQ